MADVLEPLLPPSELYEYRRGTEDEVPGWLPYAQGDVFEDVSIPGIVEDGSGLAMLFMHPCTMREGAVLREFVTVVAVGPMSSKKVLSDPERWVNRNKVMPLPDLLGNGRSTHLANFMKIGTVSSASLNRSKRVAQLSIDGRLQMQQRLIFHLSRYAPSLDVLRMATAALDLEMQAQTDWLEAANSKGQPLDEDAVLAQEFAFDEFMSASMTESSSPAEHSGPRPSRRELLSHPNSAPAVIRDVQRAIQQLG